MLRYVIMTFIIFLKQLKPIKRCIDCKHYLRVKGVNEMANNKCVKFLALDNYNYEYAYIVRSETTMCGTKGVHFELKPTK